MLEMLAHLWVGPFRNFDSGSRTMFITGLLQRQGRLMLHLVCLRLRNSKRFRLNNPILWILPRMMAYATRQQRWLETIADFNMDISYSPGKANVMADALSRKAYCS